MAALSEAGTGAAVMSETPKTAKAKRHNISIISTPRIIQSAADFSRDVCVNIPFGSRGGVAIC
jgi:hypothetical protein